MKNKNDYLDIKEWTKNKDKEMRKEIDCYISQGIGKIKAVHMVIDASCIGAGYKSQIRHDYGLSMFD